jgi:2,3-bisphosphoglycerate-independent phosphoglycerate mutase
VKYVVLIPDGAADYPVKELGGKTPLQVASTPNLDTLAKGGVVGIVRTIPPKMPFGSDVANLSVLGNDPRVSYTGRAPLEAASMGIQLREKDTAFRCNLVTVEAGVMVDYSADHITTSESRVLIGLLNKELGDRFVRFYPGVSYRHLLVLSGDFDEVKCTPPHDITGHKIGPFLPQGSGSERLRDLMRSSCPILEGADINSIRKQNGKRPATMIWLWGQGRSPRLEMFHEKYGLHGAMIAAVDLVRGIGRVMGLRVIDVPGATGYLDTNFLGKGKAAIAALQEDDFVLVHVEAPDEAGHMGSLEAKIKAIEDFDHLVVGTILEGIKKFREFRILCLPDHPTPLSIKTHTSDPVPFAIYGTDITPDKVDSFNEASSRQGSLDIQDGHRLIDFFLREEKI